MENKINNNGLIKQISDEKIAHISSLLEYKFGISNSTVIRDGNGYEIYVSNNEGKSICFQSYIMEEVAMMNAPDEAVRLKNEYVGWYDF
jgi:hypothetical protein